MLLQSSQGASQPCQEMLQSSWNQWACQMCAGLNGDSDTWMSLWICSPLFIVIICIAGKLAPQWGTTASGCSKWPQQCLQWPRGQSRRKHRRATEASKSSEKSRLKLRRQLHLYLGEKEGRQDETGGCSLCIWPSPLCWHTGILSRKRRRSW